MNEILVFTILAFFSIGVFTSVFILVKAISMLIRDNTIPPETKEDRRRWTEKEERLLIELFDLHDCNGYYIDEIAEALGRTSLNVVRKFIRLKKYKPSHIMIG